MDQSVIKRFLFFLAVFCSFPVLASTLAAPNFIQSGHFFIQGAIGVSRMNRANGKLVVTKIEQDRLKQRKNHFLPIGDLGIGYTMPFNKGLFNRLSFSVDGYFSYYRRVKGNVHQFNMTEPNYRFRMKTRSTRLIVNAKANLFKQKRFNPFILIGIGHAWNEMESYKEAPIYPVPPLSYHLKRHTHSDFVYQLGLGSDIGINKNLDASVQYLYTNAGNYTTGTKDTVKEARSLIKGAKFNAREQQIYVGLTYYFA